MDTVNYIQDIKKIRGIARHGEKQGEENVLSAIIGLDEHDNNAVFPLIDYTVSVSKEWVLFLVNRELKELAKEYDKELISAKLSIVKVEKDSLDKNKVIENVGRVEDAVYVNKDIESIKFKDFDDLYVYLLLEEKDFREASYIPLTDLCNLETYLLYALHMHIKFPETERFENTLLATEVFIDPKTEKEMVGFFYAYHDVYTHKIVYELYDRKDTDTYLNKFFPIFKEDMAYIINEVSEELEIDDLSSVTIEIKLIHPNDEDDLFGFSIFMFIKQDNENSEAIEIPLFFEDYAADINMTYDGAYEEIYLAFLKYIKGEEYR